MKMKSFTRSFFVAVICFSSSVFGDEPFQAMVADGAMPPSQGKAAVRRQASEELVENWKGLPHQREIDTGAMAGMGVLGGDVGVTVLGTFAKKLVHEGFIPDVNDQVYIEAELGPLFILSSVAWQYGAHLRWDFHYNSQWSFYSISGVGGVVSGSKLGDLLRLYPRFGLGSFFRITHNLAFRAEISHEFTGLGISVGF